VESPGAWLEAVRREERRGELLAAFDLAERGLAEHPHDVLLKHRAVLALARAGATDEAARRFAEYGLDRIGGEDIGALQARIAKDAALSQDGHARVREAAHAADLYEAVFARTGGYYPAINAATLSLIGGDAARASELAESVLDLVRAGGEDSYWAAATEAEAFLLLRRDGDAYEALKRAAARNERDYGALATTRRQLRLICETLGADLALLKPLTGPGVVHFCGHRIGTEAFPAEAEARVTSCIARVLERDSIGFAYGALAGGADILWAEALLARGVELHIVLPFADREFVAQSVASCGPSWAERFVRCRDAATEVRYATDDAFLGDDILFRYGGELAMGLALLRARYLDAEVRQLAVWDGQPAKGPAGTAIDVATWQSGGRASTVVSPAGETDESASDRSYPTATRTPESALAGRVVRAMLFGDFKWFSRLTDEQAVTFATRVLGPIAVVIQRHRGDVLHANTWGDGIALVLHDAMTAAALALELQEVVSSIDLESEGLPAHLALRLGGHVGPVFPVYDPVLELHRFTGSHVSRTARIEPVTPAGAVYVTEAFAAALVLAGNRELTCDYVGHVAAAKGYGNLRMYRLRRVRRGDDPGR
jgi:tetratricopeptide repeat protein